MSSAPQNYSKKFSMLAFSNRKVLKLDALPHSLLQRSFKCYEVDGNVQSCTDFENKNIVKKKLNRVYVSTTY